MIGTLLLNRYELLEKIGEGGMGIVYKAKCHSLNRYVAVKIIKSYLNNQTEILARFKKEANSIASLSHPNIVSTYDIGSDNNINFIVMEYINGKSLEQMVKENGRLNSSTALDIASQIAKALAFAHNNNIIHRDVKPDNILITEDNTAKLTDFGIAKVTNSVTVTNSDKLMGSVHYFSPEQAKGKFVDSRTDIYALGSVLYKMLTGQVPFTGETSISVVMMHINEPVTPPKEIIKDLPESINTVILKALEKDPINRFQTANEFAEVLDVIKGNPNFEVDFNKKLEDNTTIIFSKPNTILSDTMCNSTVTMGKDEEKSLKNKGIIKNKIVLAAGSVILTILVCIIGYFLSKEPTNIETNTTQEEIKNEPIEEKRVVPSFIGQSQNTAENAIINKGFLLGDITNEYSDTIPKGSVINQWPPANTSYEDNEKINLVISQGPKVTETITQTTINETGNEKANVKANEKSKRGKK
jgi:serine/threonine-protein kinase